MYRQEAREEYIKAMKLGQKEYKQRTAEGQDGYLPVLDAQLEHKGECVVDLGILDIPTRQIVGVSSAGRASAFAVDFLPLLSPDSEFGQKWIGLCASHLEEGIREPISCYEYLGQFYVIEGNKRVSVLRQLGAPQIPGRVQRILPAPSDQPRIKAYNEFLNFYKVSRCYQVQYRRPGDYAALLAYLDKKPDEPWTEQEQKSFRSAYAHFCEAFSGLNGAEALLPEEALLLWLQVHPYAELQATPEKELRKTLLPLWPDLVLQAQPETAQLRTEPEEKKAGIPDLLTRIIRPEHLNVAFVHTLAPDCSNWVEAHELGRAYLEQELGDKVSTRSYFHADTAALAEQALEQAVADGAEVVFTTTPLLSRTTLRAAVQHPKVQFLNCSLDTPYASVRTYFSRIYEAKFITGAIAGAMAEDGQIGYIASSPILGIPASINAFALGAQFTNPRARLFLRWECLPGTPQAELLSRGIRVISNRDTPIQERQFLNFRNYGTYVMDENGSMKILAEPVWLWGSYYVQVVRSLLSGARTPDKSRAIGDWWGMHNGVIDVKLSPELPDGVRALAESLRSGIKNGSVRPFLRRLVDQNGQVRSDGTQDLPPEELLHMDWLCENVEGCLPEFCQVEPFAQPLLRQLGLHREEIPAEKEVLP